jgi:asparagine synthase (glutamine-hydrolysing)
MCGIAGFIQYARSRTDAPRLLEQMGEAILHRGPDAGDYYYDDVAGLCHRRLSIIDLSEAGAQPMHSASGRYVVVYNGEIYNFQTHRQELEAEGVRFRGNSDTEVLLALYEKHGKECIHLLNGMFAIAIWDKREKTLFLARDRLGKKPLYYYHQNGHFVFGSEIKAMLCVPEIDRTVRPDAVMDFFHYQYVPDPKSIFASIHKLPPAHWMTVSQAGIEIDSYWDVSFGAQHRGSREQIHEELLELIDDSVRLRMISDVPLGAFLSGGVDSSAVVGMMAKNSRNPVTTCAIGFNDKKYDEVQFAEKVARQFGTDHHELTVREKVESHLVEIARMFDEPFSDPSFVPTFFVSKLARSMVTVALAGDGGDENFAGYSKYINDQLENRMRRRVPAVLRRTLLSGLSRNLVNSRLHMARRAGSLMHSLSVEPSRAFFLSNSFFRAHLWEKLATDSFKSQLNGYDVSDMTRGLYRDADTDDHLSRILYTDIKSYLPGDILVKVDRMSMANSLETRAPLLDYRVVEYAASIPSHLKIENKQGKSILKTAFEGFLTDETLYRQKMGFSVPLASWLRKEISAVAGKYLLEPDNGLSNYFDPAGIRAIWNSHQSGNVDYSQELWSLLTFEIWWQHYVR